MSGRFYIEVACEQRSYGDERICGDVFLSRKVKAENRLKKGANNFRPFV